MVFSIPSMVVLLSTTDFLESGLAGADATCVVFANKFDKQDFEEPLCGMEKSCSNSGLGG